MAESMGFWFVSGLIFYSKVVSQLEYTGHPGWHIECSAMASHVFGSRIDIHSGGSDLALIMSLHSRKRTGTNIPVSAPRLPNG